MADGLQLHVGEREGKVVIQFPPNVGEIGMDCQTAFAFSQSIAEYAITAKGSTLVIPPTQQEITNAQINIKREMLKKRVAFKLGAMARARKSNGRIAEELIDMVLAEVV